ncbi:hypothetical protein VN96_1199 [Lactococcus cremoris]|uniref:Phage protein n=1 Tax=Lactococcus cremoris subsp. cremoris IBB477 TaxID=1449093 RepID=A0A1E7G7K3_LACLC|nr:hypothetical protein [Lactococcus cremoris]KKW72746.1 hypothetical protein VN96_1199 [Lactococcus cremoris]OEU40752.1 hypothetical protein AJ89_02345 [Lactococcus cremoris subsp. cremoris IBB477]
MARLADYGIQVERLSNRATVHIDGHDFPVVLSHEALEYIGIVYQEDYQKFESDLNDFLQRSKGKLSVGTIKSSDWKIVKSLVYGMLAAGGLEDSPKDVFAWLGFRNETVKVFTTCMEVFSKNTFQVEDLKKSKKPQDFQKMKRKNNRNQKNNPKN